MTCATYLFSVHVKSNRTRPTGRPTNGRCDRTHQHDFWQPTATHRRHARRHASVLQDKRRRRRAEVLGDDLARMGDRLRSHRQRQASRRIDCCCAHQECAIFTNARATAFSVVRRIDESSETRLRRSWARLRSNNNSNNRTT